MKGSVFKRGNVWCIRYDLPPDPDNKRRQKRESCAGMGKPEAEKKLAQVLADISRGTHVEQSELTVADHLQNWLNRQSLRLSPRTVEGYESSIRLHIVPALGRYELTKLRPPLVQRFYDDLQKRGLSPKTIHNVHGVLRTALSQAIRLELIISNPAEHAELPSIPQAKIKIADSAELVRVHSAISNSKYRLCVLLAISAGLRRGETIGLQWQDFNEENGALMVCRSVVQTKGRVFVKGTKSGRDRIVMLPASMCFELLKEKALQTERRAQSGMDIQGIDWICANPDGSMLTPNGLKSEFYKLKAATGFAVNLHGLRHTWVTEQLASGVPSEVVQKRAGHATIALTHDRYGHAQPQHQEAAVAVSEKLMHPKTPIKVVGK